MSLQGQVKALYINAVYEETKREKVDVFMQQNSSCSLSKSRGWPRFRLSEYFYT